MDERVETERNNARKVDESRQLAKIQRFDMGDLADVVKQHRQKCSGQQQTAHHLRGAEHDQQGQRHSGSVEIPLLFAKAHGGKNLMNGNQADGTEYQIEQKRVKKAQNDSQDTQADNGGDDAGLHKRWFPFAE